MSQARKRSTRSGRRATRAAWSAGLGLAAVLAVSVAPARAGVTIALQPATQTVSPGAEFDVFLSVTQSGSAFNAFDVIVGHVPAALTVLQLSPLSLQEGALMTGACGNRFHRFRRGTDRDTLTDVLLCNGVSVTGPGQIYRLRLKASTTPQTTTVQCLPGAAFYDGGLAVTPVVTSDATVVIAGTVGIETFTLPPGMPRLEASPNPSRSLTILRAESDAAGLQELTVCDVLGRVVRRLGDGWFDAGRREQGWDGRDDSGARVAPGIYYARLRAPGGIVRSPIVRVE